MFYKLTEEQTMLKRMVHDFVEAEVRPHAAKWEATYDPLPDELRKKLAGIGLFGMTMPEKYGGQNLDALSAVLAMEEIGKACHKICALWMLPGNLGPIRTVQIHGTEEQKSKYIPAICRGDLTMAVAMTEPEAGSSVTDLKTSARLQDGHYVLNGQKRFITGCRVDEAYLVYVRLSDKPGARGIGAIIVEKGTPGLSFGPQEITMGGCAPRGDLFFDDCRVPKENLVIKEGEFRNLIGSFSLERIANAAMCLALAEEALEESIEYSKNRKQFGKSICEFQAIQTMLAEMAIKVEGARVLLYHAAANAGTGVADPLETSIAKRACNDAAMEVTGMAMRIHGGYGCTEHFPTASLLRNAWILNMGGGTKEIHNIRIASLLTGRKFDQRK